MSSSMIFKTYDELDFTDDFMFGIVMGDKELCREVLECLLQQPVGELTEVQTQREFKYVSDGKPIRLDVYNEDSEKRVYDAEMQNLNHKSLESLQLPKRSRFYQSSIDVDYLDKTADYSTLPESNVIFICTFDPFKQGLSKYTFKECCEEDPRILLKDGTRKIFYNCTYKGIDIPKNLRKLYDYIERKQIDNDLTKKINDAVNKARKNEKWRSEFMKERIILQDARAEGKEEGLAQGRAEGIEEGRNEQIKSMLSRGKTVEQIVEFCGYTYEQVKTVEEGMLQTVE